MNLLEQVKSGFAKWRSNRSKGNERIPEELLKLSSECAYKYGKSLVIKELGLSGSRLSDAMLIYTNKDIFIVKQEYDEQNENTSVEEIEFQEVLVKETDPVIATEDKIIQENLFESSSAKEPIFSFGKTPEQEILFELESKLGFRIKVFSKLESVHRNLISCFLDVRN